MYRLCRRLCVLPWQQQYQQVHLANAQQQDYQQVRFKGHAKWQNIQHIKKANDIRVSKLHQRYSNKINVAIRENGNVVDPRLNRALQKVIDEALSMDVRKEVVDNAIKKFNKDAAADKEFLIEVRGPGQCAILVETLANNRGTIDTAIGATLRRKHGYKDPGIKNMFQVTGVVTARAVGDDKAAALDIDRAEEIAIECDAEEVEEVETEEGAFFEFFCSPTQLMQVRGSLAKQEGLKVTAADVRYEPTVTTRLGRKVSESAMALVDELNSLPVVVAVHHNIEFARPKDKDKAASSTE